MYVRALRFAPGLRRAAKTAKLVLATNRETAEFLTQVGAKHVKSFLDGGLPAAYVSDTPPVRSQSGTLRLLWAGRMEPRKGLRLVLEAMGRLTTEDVSLTVAGSGHLEPELKKLCVELGIAEKVHFIGSVPYTEMPALFRSCDAFVFSSLRDSFGSVVLEAMAQGMAIVMLDHQGVGTFVPSEAAFKVPVLNPEETIQKLALAIDECSRSGNRLQEMQYAAWHFAQGQTWGKRAHEMAGFYEDILAGEGRSELSSQRSRPIDVPSTRTTKVRPHRAVMNEKD